MTREGQLLTVIGVKVCQPDSCEAATSVFFRPRVPASSLSVCFDAEQMRPILAGSALQQRVREAAGEERGREAGSGLHPEEAGGDALRPGEESPALDLS